MLRKEQILDTGELVAKEAEEFHRRKEERLRKLGVTLGEPDHASGDANSRDAEIQPAAPFTSSGSGGDPPDGKAVAEKATHEKAGQENHHDDAGYVMVENEEDTVIY